MLSAINTSAKALLLLLLLRSVQLVAFSIKAEVINSTNTLNDNLMSLETCVIFFVIRSATVTIVEPLAYYRVFRKMLNHFRCRY